MTVSAIAHKYPTNRDGDFIKGCKKWLDGRRIDDGAEGLWRIHDKLYDFKDFIARHPGGSQWLEVTEGIDITEQFESHHISKLAESLLPKFYVRDCVEPRNYKITFKADGFYKTLQKRVAGKLKFLDQAPKQKSKLYSDLMLMSTVLLSIIAVRMESFFVASIASFFLCCCVLIAHNFLHQRDNWRMYMTNLSLGSYREWRGELKCELNVSL